MEPVKIWGNVKDRAQRQNIYRHNFRKGLTSPCPLALLETQVVILHFLPYHFLTILEHLKLKKPRT